jgi:hypothetical protein
MRRLLPVCRAALLGAALLGWAAAARADDAEPPRGKFTPAGLEKAEKAVKDELKKLKGPDAVVTYVKDDALRRSLPGYAFFGVRYRRFPVAQAHPPSLKASNVFVVWEDKVEALTGMKDLESFLKVHLPPRTTEDQLKDSARAWLRVAEEFHQDGYYTFALEDEVTKVLPARKDGTRIAVGKSVVMKGGNGLMTARLVFNKPGKLTTVSEDSKIMQGVRPRCQATKLLDPDPVVRAMAEQDLLVMGRPAKPYLDEQRAKAGPELRRAIDRLWRRIAERDRE